MKRSISCFAGRNLVAPAIIILSLMAPVGWTIAAELKEATVTQIVKDVQLLPAQAAPRPAVVKDHVRGNTAVRTGTDSRTELTFTNQTLTRLGANTIFSFNEGTRNLNLSGGVMLLYVPKGAGSTTISSAAVSAAITGTTVMMEYHRNAYIKFISLEGTARVFLKRRLGESVLIHPGEMLIVNPNARSLPDPVDVDIKRILKTSLLITGFPPLASEPLIVQEVQNQQSNPNLIPTNLVIFGGGTLVSLVNPTNLDVISQANTAIAPPAPAIPSEFGTPSVISSPVPYLITSGTVITTDPTITTNGVTDFGKIWRGTAIDGPLSAFIFGSTSAFDTAIKLDTGAEKVGDSGAVFKFTSLELTGNPTVSTTNGQTVLALVGVNGITSGGPGGTLTFAGISTLLLATQDGSINLGPEISFSGLDRLVFYARGAGSNLTLASPILATIHLNLYAQGNIDVSSVDATLTAERIKLFAGDSIFLNGGVMSATAANSSGNVDIFAGNNISITNGLEIDRKFGGQPSGLNVSLTAADLTAGNSLVVKVDNSMGNLVDGANITLDIGNNLTINGGGDLTLIVGNDNGGHIANGGNISVMTGGSLFTQGFTLIVTNFGDVFGNSGTSVGHIDTGGNIFVTTGGNLTADFVKAFIDNHNGASITSGATISFDIGGALTTHQNEPPSAFFSLGESLFLLISNVFSNKSAGTIGSDATVSLTAGSVSVGGILEALISNRPAPAMIGGSAIINFDVSGNLTVQDYAQFHIQNEDLLNVGHGGTIKSNATITLSAANISTGEGLEFLIVNKGTIGSGGTIGGDATINVNTGNISASDIFANINNRAGHIGGNAIIDFILSGTLNLQDKSLLEIDNTNGGTIGGKTAISVKSTKPTGIAINVGSSAQLLALLDAAAPGPGGKITILATGASSSVNVNGTVHADKGTVDIRQTGDSGTINLTNADVAADIVKVAALGTNGTLNIGGGTLSADTTLKLYSPSSNGTVNFIANVTLGGTGSTIIAGNTVTIFNGVVVTVNQPVPASVFTNHPNYAGFGGNDTTTGTFAGAGATTHPLANAPPFDP